jgi:uncharacterized repeat protein (TIGR01451 family)
MRDQGERLQRGLSGNKHRDVPRTKCKDTPRTLGSPVRMGSNRSHVLTTLAEMLSHRFTRRHSVGKQRRPRSATHRLPLARCQGLESLEPRRVLSTFDLLQITDTVGEIGSISPSLDRRGTTVAFASDRDIVSGMNSDGNFEIFVLDQVRNQFAQITNTTSGDSSGPALASDTARVAFVSDADLVGNNTDGNSELFLYDLQTDSFTQVTNTTGGSGARDLSISDDGRRIAFISDRDLVGGLNPDGNEEVFSYDRIARSITQITVSTGGIAPGIPSVSGDGNWIAFTSTQDLVEGSNTDGNSEVFLYDQIGGVLTQVTNTSGGTGSELTSLDENGSRIAFDSDRDLVSGQNSDNNFEVFFAQRSSGNFTQVTNTTGATGSVAPSLSNDGTRVAFYSDRDIIPEMNTGGDEQVFVYDQNKNEFTQVTEVAGGTASQGLVMSANGARIAFESPRDILPIENDDTNMEIFLGGSAIDLEKLTNGQDADQPPGPSIPVGTTVTWTYRVTNPSLVNLSSVSVTDPDLPNGVSITRQSDEVGNDDDLLEPFEIWIYEATSTAMLGEFANAGSVTSRDTDNRTIDDSDSSNYVGSDIDLEKLTNGSDADTPTGPSTPVGSPVTWTYRVTNPSSVNLTNVTVSDPDLPNGVVISRQPDESGNNDNLLEPGEIWIYEANSTAALGQFSNTGTVTALDPNQNTLSASDLSHYVGTAVELQKLTNGEDADTPTGPSVPVGDTVVWTYRVSNPTVVNLRNVQVVDLDLPAGSSIRRLSDETGNNDNVLNPGEIWRYEATATATLGQYSNSGTVSVTDPADNLLQDSDSSHYVGTAIAIQKSTNGDDADVPTGPTIPVGDPVTWSYRVSNPSIVSLTNVEVVDADLPEGVTITRKPDESGDNDDLLEPGEIWLYEATGQAEVGQFSNLGTVSALDPSENVLTDNDTSHYVGTAVELEKSTNGEDADEAPGPSIPVGDPVTWTYRVTNPSLANLTDVQVVDPDLPDDATITRQPDEVGDDDDILEPGERWRYEATSTAQFGQFTNVGRVTARDPDENLLSDSDTSHYVGTTIALEKSTNGEDADDPTGPIIKVGDPVTWSYRVSNPNLVDLTDVVVTDPDLPDGVPIERQPDIVGDDDDVLEPDEIWLFEAVDAAELGQFANTGIVTALDPSDNQLTDSDTSHYVGTAIEITKQTNGQDAIEPTGPFIPVGNTVTWTYRVSNPSIVDLTDVDVTDADLPEGVDIIRQSDETGNNDNTLDPGEIWLYEAVGASEFGQFSNVGVVRATDPAENLLAASYDSHYFGTSILLQKSTNGEDADTLTGPLVPVGDQVTWTYRVTNPNPIDLFNVQVTDEDLPSDAQIIRLPDESGNDNDILDPGEVWLFEATGTAELGQFKNTGVVIASDSEENILEASDVSHYLGTAIDLEKLTVGEDADEPTGPAIPVDEPVVWNYRVSNPSLVELNSVSVTDPDLPIGVSIVRQADETGNNDDILDPGEVWIFEAASESVLGQYSNTGTVTATDPAENLLSDSDASHYVGTDVRIKKFTNGEDADEPTGPIIRVGDPVTWTYRVTNPSPVGLTDVNVVDADLPIGVSIDRQPDEVGNNDNILDPDEVWIFEANSTVPEERQYVNTGVVTARDPSDNLLTDSDISHHFGKNIAGLQGFAYIDLNDNGDRDPGDGGIPGILVTLEGMTAEGSSVGPVTIMTDDDGSYAFIDIPPGTYELTERQPFALIDGRDSLGTIGGEVENNRFFSIVVPVNVIGEEYNFGELGLKPEFVSKRLFLASSFPIEWYYREVIANGEQQQGDYDLARVIRDAGIPSTLTTPPASLIAPPDSPPDAEPSLAPVVEPEVHTVPTSDKSLDVLLEAETPFVDTPTEATRTGEDLLMTLATNLDGIHDGLCFPVLLPVTREELPTALPVFTPAKQDESQTPENVSASESPVEDVDQPENQLLPPTNDYGPKPAGDAFRLRDEEYLRALDEILAAGDWQL